MQNKIRVLMSATSYPRHESDWQGLFIQKIANAMASSTQLIPALWAPNGPRADNIQYQCTRSDQQWLNTLTAKGGIAHLLRSNPLIALHYSAGLLKRLRKVYTSQQQNIDIYHINWLQNSLPLYGLNQAAVITVLGTDFKLLQLPGVVPLLRQVLKTNRCVLAPNASWMTEQLSHYFSDVAEITAVPFGIDSDFYQVTHKPKSTPHKWLAVTRITQDKIGPLFKWGKSAFNAQQQLHLFGPNQENLTIPDWVHYHGPVTAQELITDWYPDATGFITLSEHSEGKPQVLLETMAAGIPIIASRQPAHSDTLINGEHGYLVNDPESFSKAIKKISKQEKHQQLSKNCRNSSLISYGNWQDCIQRYIKLYEKLLS